MTGRSLAARLALLALGLLVSVAMVEAGLRLTGLRRQFAQADASVGYVLTPNFTRAVPITDPPAHVVSLRTNNLGLRRDVDTEVARAAGVRRVLVLGDSQTEGIVENQDTFSALLEAELRRATPVEVLNAGVSGYSPLLEWLWWQQRGQPLRPDVILLVLYSGNDIAELSMRNEDFGGFGPPFAIPYLAVSPGSMQLEPAGSERGWGGRADHFLRSYLRSYELVRRVLRSPSPGGDPAITAVAAHCPGCLQSLWQEWLATSQPATLEDGFARVALLLERLQVAAQAVGAQLIVAVLPTKLQVEPATVAMPVGRAREQLALPVADPAFDETVHLRLLEVARRRGLPTIDLLPPLRQAYAATGAQMYWQQDWHLNPAGHGEVAKALLPGLLASVGSPTANRPFP